MLVVVVVVDNTVRTSLGLTQRCPYTMSLGPIKVNIWLCQRSRATLGRDGRKSGLRGVRARMCTLVPPRTFRSREPTTVRFNFYSNSTMSFFRAQSSTPNHVAAAFCFPGPVRPSINRHITGDVLFSSVAAHRKSKYAVHTARSRTTDPNQPNRPVYPAFGAVS